MAKRVPLTEDEWKLLGAEYCAGVSTNQLSKRWGISRPTIDDAARKNGWQRDPELKAALAAQTQQKVHGNLQVSPELQQAAIEQLSDERSQVLHKHRMEWKGIYKLREDAFRLLKGDDPKMLAKPIVEDVKDETGKVIVKGEGPLTLTKRVNIAAKLIAMFEADARAIMTAQEGERRAHGFDYKVQQEGGKQDEDGMRRRRELAGSIIEMADKLKRMAGNTNTLPPPPASPPPAPKPKPIGDVTIDGDAA